ncbi:MAG: LptF/LptG family permease [Planctomycetes bacterium]|nr:LptF/LptG family permease [Planctomycetota bacterium]
MTILDRYILRGLIVNYLITLAIMLSLYLVLDLFFNIDEFTESGEGVLSILGNIAGYYKAHSLLYFAQLSGVIMLFACMATLARMRRANELIAVLTSGVSLYRVAVPVLAFGLLTTVLWYVDTEVLIPSVGHELARRHEDASGSKARGVWFLVDTDGALLSARRFFPRAQRMEQLLILHRDESGALVKVIEADAAQWKPIPGHPAGGVWKLERGIERRRVRRDDRFGSGHEEFEVPVSQYAGALDPAAIEMRQSQQWISYLSSSKLSALGERDPSLLNQIRQVKHTRFTTPLVHLLMLLLGLPFFLRRESANIVADAGKCLVVCGLCFLLAFAGENFVRPTTLSALPAWLPLIVFTPVAVILVDRIKT